MANQNFIKVEQGPSSQIANDSVQPDPAAAILAWASQQPSWRQDALRRILTKPFTKGDEDECLELLSAEHGVCTTALVADRLSATHLPIRSSTATNLRLASLDQITHVNRLASDAALALAPTGMTLIYGDNGSGKSGFVRILKKACRARDDEAILPDVYTASLLGGVASARFTVQDGTASQPPVMWRDDGQVSSDVLARLAIFDSRCANVHVDGENRLEVVPHDLDCFEKLAQVCDRLKARLKADSEALEKQLAGTQIQPPAGTSAEKFVSALSTKTEVHLTAAAAWSEVDQKRITELNEMLKDPIAEAQRCERIAKALETYVTSLEVATNALSDAKLADIAALKNTAKELRTQANASAAAAFAKEPLGGIGGEPWRAMFDAAREYSEKNAFPGEAFPVVKAGAQCVLCEQVLDASAQDRFARFSNFVTGAMNAKAGAAEAARDAALQTIHPATLIVDPLAAEASAYLEQFAKTTSDMHAVFRNALMKRRTQTLADEDASEGLPVSPMEELKKEIGALTVAANEARALASAGTEDADALRKEHAELTGNKMLNTNQAELKRRIGIHANIAAIQKTIRACDTTDISVEGSRLLRTHVTEKLTRALSEEQKSLGLALIPIGLSDRTPKGVIQHRLRLDGATLAPATSAVLSEGEHRAVALAVFLAELKMYPGKDAIIIDDPVSSLDHVRREKVAERLVIEAKDRQVIVFTHDLAFLAEVRLYAAERQTPLRVVGIRRGPNGFGSLDPDGEPWSTKALPGRRQWLVEQLARLKKLHADGAPDYEPHLRFFFDRLRQSWEKLVEEKLFAQVLTRFLPQVQTSRLRDAVIDDDLFAEVHFGMTAASKFTGHDQAAAKGGAIAGPDECEKGLNAFIACLGHADDKIKVVTKQREARTKAPKA